jgi:7TM-HD extracellular.
MKRTKFLEFLKNNSIEIKSRYSALLIILLIASVLLTFLLYNGLEFIKNKYKAGEIARKTVIAKRSFRYVNTKATNAILKKKIAVSPDVYLYYPEIKTSLTRRIKKAFSIARTYKDEHKPNEENQNITENIFESKLGVKLNKKVLDEFYYLNYNKNVENYILKIVSNVYKTGVLSKLAVVRQKHRNKKHGNKQTKNSKLSSNFFYF